MKTLKVVLGAVLMVGMVFGAVNPHQVRVAKDGPLCIPHINCPR